MRTGYCGCGLFHVHGMTTSTADLSKVRREVREGGKISQIWILTYNTLVLFDKCTCTAVGSYYLQMHGPSDAEQRSWWGSGKILQCPHTSSECLSLLDTGGKHTHTHMKTTYTIGLWGYVCLSDQGLEPSYLHIFSLINYLGVPDVLKYTLHHVSVCAHEQILSMLYMYVWTHIWAGYCRCDGGSICESVCWWAESVEVHCWCGQDRALQTQSTQRKSTDYTRSVHELVTSCLP